MKFSASLDRTTKIISACVIALPLVIFVFVQTPIVLGLAVLIGILGYAWSPLGYEVSPDAIIVKRLIGKVVLPRNGVREARACTADDLKGALRLFGSGGLFGYYGTFRTSRLGACTWYVTNRRRMVVVAGQATWLFSPDDVGGFLEALGAPSSVPGEFAIKAPGSKTPLLVGGALVLATAGFIGWVTSYNPGLPGYTFEGHALAIHDRFYPVTLQASDIDVSQAGVVDIGSGEWRPVARTNGFANARYLSGWFRVENGQKVRLYAAAGVKRLVLLPGKNGKTSVLLQASDPEQFVADTKRALQP
jgi:hypothetical protein